LYEKLKCGLVSRHKVWVQLPPAGNWEDREQQRRLAQTQRDPERAQIRRKNGDVLTSPLTVDVQGTQEITLSLD
jgi:hypothetical protein